MNPRGRPRDPMIDDKVTTATLTLLAANGYSGLRVDDVARTSGVAKTTIYRRWPHWPWKQSPEASGTEPSSQPTTPFQTCEPCARCWPHRSTPVRVHGWPSHWIFNSTTTRPCALTTANGSSIHTDSCSSKLSPESSRPDACHRQPPQTAGLASSSGRPSTR